MKRNLYVGAAFVATLGGLWIGSEVLAKRAEGASVMAPRFEVDPLWPKPLPNHWLLGQTITYHGQRVQKFMYKGLVPVGKPDQGVVWPKTAKGSI